jgi:hypothetical protein
VDPGTRAPWNPPTSHAGRAGTEIAPISHQQGEADFTPRKVIGYSRSSVLQRHPIYRRLKHRSSILRRAHGENVRHQVASRSHRMIYASNHKSHIDYLAELLC